MTRPACVVIDRLAAKANLQRVRALVPRQKVMAIIKANAYGHGLTRMGEAFRDADALGVACLEEAEVLREAGVQHPIVLLEGPFTDNELSELQRLSIETVVHHEEQVRMLERLSHGEPIAVWIKIDTGMHRLGFPPEQAREVWQRLSQCSHVASPLRLMTHLACAHERGHPSVGAQLGVYHEAIRGLSGEQSIANSSGILAWPETHGDWVRPGIML